MATEIENLKKSTPVRVVVRIRPQNARELINMSRICTTVIPNEPQIILGVDKSFTFDYVFNINSSQDEIYSTCVEQLVKSSLSGFNATILAYGQTGSGKTYTMGMGFDRNISENHNGIIIRAARDIFSGIERMQEQKINVGTCTKNINFNVGVQFMELYNEEIIDLLDPFNKDRLLKIHENCRGEISVAGLTIKTVHNLKEVLSLLQQGALARTTASTKLNDQSSRSHAVFTILIKQQKYLLTDLNGICSEDLETTTSKFNFVDLAGSERLKRTEATGNRAKEAISINCGLLALGNVVSALGDASKKSTYIPYRDSKLTRLLQDSLGGNSQTLVISCISPSDCDFMETLNTLQYANRAKNIKNKVQINQDKNSQTICQLRREIAALQLELLEYKQGKRFIDSEGISTFTDTYHENNLLLDDNKRLHQRIKALQETINCLITKNSQLKLEKQCNSWSYLEKNDRSIPNIIAEYIGEIEKLQAKLIENEQFFFQVNKHRSFEKPFASLVKIHSDSDSNFLNQSTNVSDIDFNKASSNFDAENGEQFLGHNDSNDSVSEVENNDIETHLNEINCSIEIKTKLIQQLELTQQRMQLMRRHYEEKLDVLSNKIISTQKERDEIIVHLGSENNVKNKMQKIRNDYEHKIKQLKLELTNLHRIHHEHVRQNQQLKVHEESLLNLRRELKDLKEIKLRLMRRLDDQCKRYKIEDSQKNREIAKLRRDQRKQLCTVKSLQAQLQSKDQILKRKTEEYLNLQKSFKSVTSQKSEEHSKIKNKTKYFSQNFANQLWNNLSRTIAHAAQNKQAIIQLEKELERLMVERSEIGHMIGINSEKNNLLDSEIENDNFESNLKFIENNITHVQQAIIDFEEGSDSVRNDNANLREFIKKINTYEEAKFLIHRLIEKVITVSCNLNLTQCYVIEQKTLLKNLKQESQIQQQLIQHLLAENGTICMSNLLESVNLCFSKIKNNFGSSEESLNSNGTYDISPTNNYSNSCFGPHYAKNLSFLMSENQLQAKNTKVRRRTTHTDDLLFGNKNMEH